MRESVRLGRIAGIRVGLNFSVFVIVAILVVGLAFGRFPQLFPGHGPVAYTLAGLLSAVLFLGSLLVHELAHAVTARRHGVEVNGIVLWLFGGVAELRGEPATPGADFRIAVVGPVTSVLAGLVFGAIAVVLAVAGATDLVIAIFGYLAGVNVVLAVFNLVPAAPLDGGRVLRALLWRRSGDRARAAVSAARAGRVFGYALVAVGFLEVVSGLGFSGLWLVLLGLFLVNLAMAEEQQTRIGQRLRDVRVRDVMTRDPIVAAPEETLSSFILETVLANRFSTYPLVDEDRRLVGLTTLNRIRGVPADQRESVRLGDVSVPENELAVAGPDELLNDVLPRMAGGDDNRVVVVNGDRHIVGVLSPRDVNRALARRDLAEPMRW
jgi:Zn-dependent protease/predicted transcriptional regulator